MTSGLSWTRVMQVLASLAESEGRIEDTAVPMFAFMQLMRPAGCWYAH